MIANIHEVLCLLELFGTFTCTWPGDSNSSKWKIILRDIRWTFTVTNIVLLMISLAFGIYHYQNDLVILMKTITELTSLVEVLLNLLLCRINRAKLEVAFA